MRLAARFALAVALLPGLGVSRAQFTAPVIPDATASNNAEFGGRGSGMEPSLSRDLQQRQLKKLRQLHQKEMVTDTDRMVVLATAMKDEVDKGNKTLNADVMKDADELAKLAKRVGERIKTQ